MLKLHELRVCTGGSHFDIITTALIGSENKIESFYILHPHISIKKNSLFFVYLQFLFPFLIKETDRSASRPGYVGN